MSSIAHLLNARCQITPVSVGSWTVYGGLGHIEGSPVTAQCRIVPLSAREREVLERQSVLATHAVYLMTDVDVNRGDKLLIQGGLVPTREMIVESVEMPSVPDVYQKVYANVEQRRYEVA